VRTAQRRFSHLVSMTDATGLFEHARFSRPRIEHGYCVDDVARGLIVLCRATPERQARRSRQPELLEPSDSELARRYLTFLIRAQASDGQVTNRCDVHGVWHAQPGVEDCWGRALWAFGTAASRGREPNLAGRALAGFDLGASRRSPWPRSMAFAGLGAAEVLRIDARHVRARALLSDAAEAVGRPQPNPDWPWPWPRLTYANAVIPDLMMAAGDCLNDGRLVDDGLTLLGWLLDVETAGDHLSLTPTGGWGPGEPRPGFDQQPIEVASLADACARAFELTGDPRWSQAVGRCAAWFHGANDLGIVLADEATGGCCDGLERDGRNENQGAESTLALISTLQHADRLAPGPR
jgi:hypothetical protein